MPVEKRIIFTSCSQLERSSVTPEDCETALFIFPSTETYFKNDANFRSPELKEALQKAIDEGRVAFRALDDAARCYKHAPDFLERHGIKVFEEIREQLNTVFEMQYFQYYLEQLGLDVQFSQSVKPSK